MRSFDPEIVVVGAGSAGAVVAARATEGGARSVLLLEAGPDYDGWPLPSDLDDGTRNSWDAHDWHYRHQPTPEQRIPFVFPRGRVVGGSSAVNTCIALRGQPYDYDEWELDDWRFDRVLPFFKKLEVDRDFGDRPYHGVGGPIPIRRHPPSELGPGQAAFIDAARALGHSRCDDTNDPATKGGVGPHAMNKIDGKRMSAARGYLTPEVRAREAFRLRAETLVRRIVFDDRRHVRSVEVETKGAFETIPTRTVVLAAGAIATPGILLRSGVGPRDQIERIGVDLVRDVPAINRRLLDHPGSAIFFVGLPGIHRTDQALIQTVLRFTSKGSAYPNDLQLQPGSFLPIHPRVTLPMPTLMCCVGKPRGHGRMVFRSADPRSKPEVRSDFLADGADREKAVEAVLHLRALAATAPLRKLARLLWPTDRMLRTPDRIAEWIPKMTGSGYHPCGTVPMGADGAADAATDSRGRVRGVDGLFVVDASLFPTVPSANTNLTALMFGERFGEWFRHRDL